MTNREQAKSLIEELLSRNLENGLDCVDTKIISEIVDLIMDGVREEAEEEAVQSRSRRQDHYGSVLDVQ
jgi:hypothetical protein